MPLNPNALKHLINSNNIENIYLFSGPEIGEKKEIINLIEKKLFGKEEPVKFTYYCGNDFAINEVLTTLQTKQLFSEKKIIYIKNIEDIDAESIKKITHYIIPQTIDIENFEKNILNKSNESNKKILLKYYKHDNNYYTLAKTLTGPDKKSLISVFNQIGFKNYDADTYLIMINETKERIPSGLQDLLTENQNIIFWEMFDSQKSEWIREEFKNAGLYIENEAIDYILDAIENNKDQLKNEINKITMLFKEKSSDNNVVRKSFIEEHLYHSKEENSFTLYSAMLDGDLDKALDILEAVFYADEDSLLNGLVWSHRNFLKAVDLYENQGIPINDIFKNLGIMSKKNKSDIENGLRRYNFYHASIMFYYLSELDYYLKTLPSNFKLIKLQEFIIKFMNQKNNSPSFLKGEICYKIP
jgi:DNA polymerase-3 subunit delta